MIVGEHTRENDLEVNVVKGKKLTNVRASGKDDAVLLTPPIKLTLEMADELHHRRGVGRDHAQVDPPAQALARSERAQEAGAQEEDREAVAQPGGARCLGLPHWESAMSSEPIAVTMRLRRPIPPLSKPS